MTVVIPPTISCCSGHWWHGRTNSAWKPPARRAPHFRLLNLMRRTRLIHLLLTPLGALLAKTARLKLSLPARPLRRGNSAQRQRRSRTIDRCWSAIVILLTLAIARASFSMYRPA